jgi:hypothetical protein
VVTGTLLVSPSDDVIGHDASSTFGIGDVHVEADEKRYGSQPLHRGTEIAPHHRRQLVGLAVEGQGHPLDLLVVLEFDGEQTHQLDGNSCGARDTGRRVLVGDIDLLHVAVRDQIALSRATIARNQHSTRIRDGNDGRAVWCEIRHVCSQGQRPRLREEMRGVVTEVIGEGRVVRAERRQQIARQRVGRTVHRHWPPF